MFFSDERKTPMQTVYPINLEREAHASYNYLENMIVPQNGFTYFNVFLTDPAEAVHDWPDFIDVPSRTAEACVLLRHMTGIPVNTEEACFKRIYGFQEEDGLFYRPQSRITRHEFVREEQALVMGALIAKAIADKDDEAHTRLERLIEALNSQETGAGSFPAMLIRPVARVWEAYQWRRAESLLEKLTTAVCQTSPVFRPNGGFAGHVHSHLYAAAGLTEVGRLTGDDKLISHMDRVFQWIRDRSTRFGFVPEVSERADDVVGCETCCLMDYIHLAISLAKAGRTNYYDDVERAVRNHLIESRVKNGDWLPSKHNMTDDDLIRRNGVGDAAEGAYAGWSCPNHILAYDEWLPSGWIKSPELASIYLNKVRALQNCCGPSGPKALYLAWRHASKVIMENGGNSLRINLLLDRSLPDAEVRCNEPWEGRVEVCAKDAFLSVAMRCPSWTSEKDMTATVNGRPMDLQISGGYAMTPSLSTGDCVEFRYPLEVREELVRIGNEGRQSYRYRVGWRGGTVMEMKPGKNPSYGVSHLMPAPVQLYYGNQGPHPLYQRGNILQNKPSPLPLHSATGPEIW